MNRPFGIRLWRTIPSRIRRFLGLAILGPTTINLLFAGAPGSPIPQPPSIHFQRFKLIDGFPYAEFAILNATDNPIWFQTAEGQDPAYLLEVRSRKMEWQDATPGVCGLTQFTRVELSPHGSRPFVVNLPVLASVIRVKIPIYMSHDGPEQKIASAAVTAPADLVRPTVPGPVAPPDEVLRPKALSRAVPPYPEIAMRAKLQGTVVLRVVVGPTGTVDNVQVMKGQALLAIAAVDAVKTWRYSPVIWRGQPASVIITESIIFRLNDAK